MEMPKPGAAHQKLAALVGDWAGAETLHPSPWDPAGGRAAARVTNRWIADGFAVVQDYEQSRNGEVTFRGHGVFWYDPARDEYVMHWWDSMGGMAGEFRGRLEGDRLTLASPTPQGGHSRTSWVLTGPDAHDFLMEMSPDGTSWHPAMEGTYTRHVSRPARRVATKKAKRASARRASAATSTARPKARKAAAKSAKKASAARKAAPGRGRRRTGRRK